MKTKLFIIAIVMVVSVITGCSTKSSAPEPITLTEEEKNYVKEAYLITQFSVEVFDAFANSAGEYEVGGASAEEMFGHMLVFAMLEGSLEKLPETPDRFVSITDNLTKALTLFPEGVTGITVELSQNDKNQEAIDTDLAKLNEAADYLIAAEEELDSILTRADMEEEKEKIKADAKKIGGEISGTKKQG